MSPITVKSQSLTDYTSAGCFLLYCFRVGESSVIGQHRPTQQPEAPRRARASVMQLFGGGPEKGLT